MRLLVEILVAAAVIALGWEKSVHQRLSEVPVIGGYFATTKIEEKASPPRRMVSQPAKPIDPPNKTFTGHIFYKDETGKSYWLDAQGQRHYGG